MVTPLTVTRYVYPIPAAPRVACVREGDPGGVPKPRLLDRVRAAIRTRYYSRRTEEAYIAWIRRYIFFHGKRHPVEMGAPEMSRFLTSLAVDRKIAASTQNQALSALLFLYRAVLEIEVPWMDDLVRARRPERLPVVLTRGEVRAVLQHLTDPTRLMAYVLYGAGLRLLECCRLRVQDVDLETSEIVVRAGKGDKDRVTMLPAIVRDDLAAHIARMREQHSNDLALGAGRVELPPPSHGSIPTPLARGGGNGCSPPRGHTWIGTPVSDGAITCTNPSCSAPSRMPSDTPAS